MGLICKRTVIVSHSAFLKSLAPYLVLDESLNEDSLRGFDETFVMDNAGVSKIMFND